jgi:hypothetical protein
MGDQVHPIFRKPSKDYLEETVTPALAPALAWDVQLVVKEYISHL